MNDELGPVLTSLLAAVDASPDDVPLRLHVAELLLNGGSPELAALHASQALNRVADHAEAIALLAAASAKLSGARAATDSAVLFDWQKAEREVADLVPGSLVSDIRLDDVGGMTQVKRRLELAFLAPMRNPELRALYGKSLHGGLLLYGPPGCGKTFLARAIAGELGANFQAVSLADVLDMWIGSSERNLREVFERARASTPCVLFLDEIDAIGQKRSNLRANPAMRGTVNQLLSEMDSVKADNTGVFVLGATNHPWDVDTALLRPGRFDRMLLVTPPDQDAREAILRYHLRERPLDAINVAKLARGAEHFSGADLAHLCDSAAELAFEDSVCSGQPRPIRMGDFSSARKHLKPTTASWLEDAKNVVMFANADGRYDDLLDYLRQRRLL